jgi:uncharacterized membrane protein YphA (DoxX/SURF4 family)
MAPVIDVLHLALRRSRWAARLVVATRVLLATAFIPTGLVKVLGQRFTLLSTDDPVGALFEAFYQTGAYWRFLGWAQVVAGVLLLLPRTAALGAVVFLPIIANIVVITWSVDFAGTPLVTSLMLAGTVLLVFWDYHGWKRLVLPSPAAEPPPLPAVRWAGAERALLVVGTIGGLLLFLGTRGLVPMAWARAGLVAAGLAMPVLGALWIAQDAALRRERRATRG